MTFTPCRLITPSVKVRTNVLSYHSVNGFWSTNEPAKVLCGWSCSHSLQKGPEHLHWIPSKSHWFEARTTGNAVYRDRWRTSIGQCLRNEASKCPQSQPALLWSLCRDKFHRVLTSYGTPGMQREFVKEVFGKVDGDGFYRAGLLDAQSSGVCSPRTGVIIRRRSLNGWKSGVMWWRRGWFQVCAGEPVLHQLQWIVIYLPIFLPMMPSVVTAASSQLRSTHSLHSVVWKKLSEVLWILRTTNVLKQLLEFQKITNCVKSLRSLQYPISFPGELERWAHQIYWEAHQANHGRAERCRRPSVIRMNC